VQSVTSPGYEAHLPKVPPRDVASALVEHNRQLAWADTQHRGYMTLELTREIATNEWLFLDTVRQRSTRLAGRHQVTIIRGTNRLA
jgi:alkaline phosphatase D